MSGLPGNKCVYFNCGDTKRLTPGLRMFRFPKDEDLCRQWIYNTGNANTELAGWPTELLRSRVICHKHFREDDYRTVKRHFLKIDAVPILFEDPDFAVDPPKKMRFQDDPGSLNMPNKLKKSQRITFAVHKYRNSNKSVLLPILAFLSSVAKTFVKMQLKRRHRGWYKAEKKFALSFYFKSPSAYRYLRQKGLILPSVCTIRKWISENKFSTGVDDGMQKLLKLKCSSMTPKEKKCIVAFNELSIKEYLEYNKELDIIEGLQDLGPLGRSPNNATHALLFAIRGLYSKWKIPFAYFFSDKLVSREKLKILIIYVLKTLINIGFSPKALVCDQAINKQKAMRMLGVSEDQPYFVYKGQTFFVIYDMSHLFNSIWKEFLSGTFQLFDKIISFNVIKEAYEIDNATQTTRSMPEITNKHINPNNVDKTSCKLAVELFSSNVAVALRKFAENGQINENLGHDTAFFIDNLSNLFSALSSGLTDKNELTFTSLQAGIDIFQSLTKLTLKKSKQPQIEILLQTQKSENLNIKESRPPCFDGMVQTIKAVLQLYEKEKEDQKSFLSTSHLNQDFLDHYFSVVRECCGGNNPTARLFRLSFRIQTISSLLSLTKLTNCQEENSEFLTLDLIQEEENTTIEQEENMTTKQEDITEVNIFDANPPEIIKKEIMDATTFKTDVLIKNEMIDDPVHNIAGLNNSAGIINCGNDNPNFGYNLSNEQTNSVIKCEEGTEANTFETLIIKTEMTES